MNANMIAAIAGGLVIGAAAVVPMGESIVASLANNGAQKVSEQHSTTQVADDNLGGTVQRESLNLEPVVPVVDPTPTPTTVEPVVPVVDPTQDPAPIYTDDDHGYEDSDEGYEQEGDDD